MALIKWNPENSFDFFNDIDSHISRMWKSPLDYREAGQALIPRVDIMEKGEMFELRFELPGVSKKEINVEIKDEVLTVSGEKTAEELGEKERCYMNERRYGKFSRSFRLSEHVSSDNISAKYSDGILTLLLNKSEQSVSNSKMIKVE